MHEIDFGNAPVRVEIYAAEENVEILIDADSETLPEERRRFALLNIPRHLLTKPPPQQREPSSCNIGLKRDFGPRLACGFGAFIHDPDRCLKTAPPPFPKGTPD